MQQKTVTERDLADQKRKCLINLKRYAKSVKMEKYRQGRRQIYLESVTRHFIGDTEKKLRKMCRIVDVLIHLNRSMKQQ